MRGFLQDVRYSLRISAKTPAFTAVAVLTLALGIGASTTVFSWIDAILLRPLPGTSRPSELFAFETKAPNGDHLANSYPDYRDHRDHLKLLSGLAAAQPAAFNIGEEQRAQRVWGELVTGNYFTVLGVNAVLGRTFLPEEFGDKPGAFPVAVVSHRFWKSQLNSDPNAIGRTLRINRQNLTIVGVAPPEFRGTIGGLVFDVWVPLMMGPTLNGVGEWMLRDRKTRQLVAVARLRPDVGLEQARAEVVALAAQLAKMDPYTNGGISATLLPIWQSHIGAQSVMLGPLQILMAICFLVLAIACANVASLLLARFTVRQREFSVRVAMGARRTRVARQIFTETLVLALLSALVSIPLTLWLAGAANLLMPPTNLPLTLEVNASAGVIGFTALLCLVATLLSAVVPAWHTSRADLVETLKEGGRSGGARTHGVRSVLVVAEVALALVALAGAGLFMRSFREAAKINPGFEPKGVLLAGFQLAGSGYNLDQRKQFAIRLRERLESSPGVTSVAYSDNISLGFAGSWWEDMQIEGYVPPPSENMKLYRNVVSPGYFALMHIPIVDGRDFTEQDDERSLPVMIVNQAFARRFLAGRNPIGYKARGWGRWFTIVGVARDSKYHRLTEQPMPYFYVPFRQVFRADMSMAFYVRTAGNLNDALAALRREVRQIDPDVVLLDPMPLAEYIAASLYPQKMAASLLSVLGLLALVLAAVGLYSVMAYAVTERTHEIGVRLALGAKPLAVLGMVLRQGMRLTGAGLAAGLVLVLVLARLVSAWRPSSGALLTSGATDPVVYLAAALFLALVAAVASLFPARRAARVDPVVSLRYQ